MYNKQMEIDQLISETMDALLASGIAKQTAWSAGYYGGFRSVRKYYSQRKQTVYTQEIMGHNDLSATAYYIHLLPENLVKSSGIDWASFSALLPEMEVWPD